MAKQRKTDQPTMHLPDEVLIDILLKLPVKSLFLFRSVCKHWLNLIQTPSFINLHTNHPINARNNHEPLLIIRTLESPSLPISRNIFLTLLSDDETLAYKYDVALEVLSPSMASRGLGLKEEKLHLLGPCNGVFCLTDTVDIVLFNPAIRQCRNVPFSPLSSPSSTCSDIVNFFDCVGFGFDPVCNDYKVIRVHVQEEFDNIYDVVNDYYDDVDDDVFDDDDDDDDDDDVVDGDDDDDFDDFDDVVDSDDDDDDHRFDHYFKIEMFSLSTNCWRELDVVSPFNINRICSHSFFFNGAFHWLGGEDDEDITSILVFDLNKEAFDRFELPQGYSDYDLACIRLSVLNESLALILQWKFDVLDLNVEFEVWAMKEYEVDVSWSKLYTIEFDMGIERPLSFSKKWELLVENDEGRLVSYNLETKAMKKFEVHGVLGTMNAFRYRESLISLK